jgi:hypothetical protein
MHMAEIEHEGYGSTLQLPGRRADVALAIERDFQASRINQSDGSQSDP